jgi:hypothetical protein
MVPLSGSSGCSGKPRSAQIRVCITPGLAGFMLTAMSASPSPEHVEDDGVLRNPAIVVGPRPTNAADTSPVTMHGTVAGSVEKADAATLKAFFLKASPGRQQFNNRRTVSKCADLTQWRYHSFFLSMQKLTEALSFPRRARLFKFSDFHHPEFLSFRSPNGRHRFIISDC